MWQTQQLKKKEADDQEKKKLNNIHVAHGLFYTICQLHTIYKPFQLCVLSAFKMEAALVLQLMILINQYQPEILWILTQSVYYTE